MELFIGGAGQGKLEYVLNIYKDTQLIVIDGEKQKDFLNIETGGKKPVFDHFHLWIRENLKNGKDIETVTEEFFAGFPDCIIISDEIGNGLVPIDAFERKYRDETGRALIRAAQLSERVERILCGLGQRLK